MTDLESRLAALRDELAWPPTPDLAAAVGERLVGEGERLPARRALAHRLARARPATAAAVALLAAVAALAAALAASPSVRARIADWLGIGAVRVQRVERLPRPAPGGDLGLGDRTTLAGARRAMRAAAVPTLRALGAPDAVYVDAAIVPGGAATLAYGARRGLPAAGRRVGALLTVIAGDDLSPLRKLVDSGTPVRRVDVDGARGFFIAGPHFLSPPSRLAGNTLLWVRGGATYRLETRLGQAGALRLARSAR